MSEGVRPVVRVVWHSQADAVHVPVEMGLPRPDQLQGTPLDQLTELAGRVCYDSCGSGRNSADYHQHIRDVRHHSVLRHANLTFGFDAFLAQGGDALVLGALAGRPGVQLTGWQDSRVRFTCNMQAAREWFQYAPVYAPALPFNTALGRHVQNHYARRAPLAMGPVEPLTADDVGRLAGFAVESPLTTDEVYASVFFSNVSRVRFSQELFRHTYCCAPSQRSGRYVDDRETPWIMHPLLREGDGPTESYLRDLFDERVMRGRSAYCTLATSLERLLKERGLAPLDAKKQARSAARGVLGQDTGTELVFTASLSAWSSIFRQRCHPAADAEIREVMEEVRRQLAALWPRHFPEHAPVATVNTSPATPGTAP